MYQIQKTFSFSASHVLMGLPDGHPCGRTHGHNYVVEVILESGDLDPVGFVVDYGELRVIKQYIDDVLDHRHLNEVLPVQPSAENIARHIYDRFKPVFPQLAEVRISETPKTWATYRPVDA